MNKMLFINRKDIKYFLLFLPYLMSATVYTQTNSAFANILLIFKFIAFVIVVFLYLKNNKFSTLDFTVLAYCVWWFIAVLVNGQAVLEYVKEIVVILFYMFVIEEACYSNSHKYAIRALSLIIVAELFINFVLLIVYPEGLWSTVSIYNDIDRYNFLGLDNQTTPILILASLLLGIDYMWNECHITVYEIFWAFLIIGNLILMQSGTAITALIVLAFVAIISIKFRRFFNIKIALFFIACVFVGVVFFRMQNIFAFFIEDVLEKDLSLTNRVEIWDRAIELICNKPIIGYGIGTLETIIIDRNAHNFFLQIILQSGIVGLLLYLNIIRVALKKVISNSSENISIIIGSCLSGYFVCCIAEVYAQGWLIIMLVISYNCLKMISRGG